MNMFANTMVAHHGHESAEQAPSQTRDMHNAFGVGTEGRKDTGAGLVERSMQVQVTNPAMRAGKSQAVREEKQRLTARSVDVVARSGNQAPEQVDNNMKHGFIWGQVGEGDEAPPKPNLWVNLGLAAVGIAALWWTINDRNKD